MFYGIYTIVQGSNQKKKQKQLEFECAETILYDFEFWDFFMYLLGFFVFMMITVERWQEMREREDNMQQTSPPRLRRDIVMTR